MTEFFDRPRRRLLPLLPTTRHGSRSHLTCHYRCGNACDAPVLNQTDNPYFADVAVSAVSRRGLLKGAGAGALLVGFGAPLSAAQPAAAAVPPTTPTRGAAAGSSLSFTPARRTCSTSSSPRRVRVRRRDALGRPGDRGRADRHDRARHPQRLQQHARTTCAERQPDPLTGPSVRARPHTS